MINEIKDLINKLVSYVKFKLGKFLLHDTVKTQSKAYVTESIRRNVDFQGKAGLQPKIIRSSGGKCCPWCSDVEGTYNYPKVPKDVYRRHRGCTCSVDYYPGDGRHQNVHSKVWYERESEKAKENYNSLQKNLSENELMVVNQYISSDSYKINDKLRRDIKLNAREKHFVNNLDSALEKMDNYEGDLYRVVDFTGFLDCEERTKKFIDKFKIGDRIKFDEYISTSKETGYNDDANVFIYIKNAKNGKDISKYNTDEQEVLYKRGSSFITKSIKKIGNNYYIKLFEEI